MRFQVAQIGGFQKSPICVWSSVRVEFVCGGRAVRRARADFEALTRVSQVFSAALDEVPAMVAAQVEAARAGEKARRKVELELAAYRGKELYTATAPGADGIRRATQRSPRGNLEDLRAVAQNFTAQSQAIFLAILEEPPSVLLAASEDAAVDAGKVVKAAVTANAGRGGGNARIAQGSVPQASALEAAVAWSYDLLSDAEREVFVRLGVFPADFSLEVAELVVSDAVVEESDILDVLTRLVEKSLVTTVISGDTYRYRLLETLREYALARLVERGEVDRWNDCLLEWAMTRVEYVEESLRRPAQDAALQSVRADAATLRAAMNWADTRGDQLAALRIASAVVNSVSAVPCSSNVGTRILPTSSSPPLMPPLTTSAGSLRSPSASAGAASPSSFFGVRVPH